TGQPVWTHINGNNNIVDNGSGLAVANGYVYYACRPTQNFGTCALNQSDGTTAWTYENMTFDGISVSGGVVYVNGVPQTNGGPTQVFALNGTSGSLIWSYNYTAACCGPFIPQPPAVAKGKVYVAVSGMVYAFAAKTGALKWTATEVDYSGVSVANGVAYFFKNDGQGAHLTARQASNGTSLFTSSGYGSGHSNYPPPIIVNGTVYTSGTATTCDICAYGLTAGRTRHR
ncbi:MAG: PQQ-like beta-propeller repeat protein, partial [Candidatus Eremiobacteraeota bacterium]|nr:PQQ-like beta-propeller repeat protein [Candidatus Eremiobacteraeota bacterium]